jgi:dTDP-glucose 4,6-dehydratase
MTNFFNKTVFITGGTGFIGSRLIQQLVADSANIICYGRDIRKIFNKFGTQVTAVTTFDIADTVDFIIHAACPTNSNTLANNPVETISSIYTLTKESLELAKRTNARYLYLSSMEVYSGLSGRVDESKTGMLDLTNSRNSYPSSKQLAELLTNSYYNEYGTNTSIVRLSQVFGPGVAFDDNRLFTYAIRQALNGEDIILKTDGQKLHNSCYIDDVIFYILHILVSDIHDTVNITNESYCHTINDLCDSIINTLDSRSKVIHDITANSMYPPNSQSIISANKLNQLFPTYEQTSFDRAVQNTANYLRQFKPLHNSSS